MHLVHYGNMGCQQNLKKKFANNQHIQRKIKLYFVNGHSANLSKCAKIWPSKSIFMSKIIWVFQKKIIEPYISF